MADIRIFIGSIILAGLLMWIGFKLISLWLIILGFFIPFIVFAIAEESHRY